MASVRRFEDLEVFQMARDLAKRVYQMSATGRFERDYGLREQMRRAALSVMSNIAEGFERGGDKEFTQFLYLAKGSCGEIRAQLYVALDQQYLTEEQFDSLRNQAVRISAALAGLVQYLHGSGMKGSKFRTDAPRLNQTPKVQTPSGEEAGDSS